MTTLRNILYLENQRGKTQEEIRNPWCPSQRQPLQQMHNQFNVFKGEYTHDD